MLALTRKKDEAIIIDNNIEIRIIDVQGDKVKLGISAPKDISIYRKEIYVEIQKSNTESVIVNSQQIKQMEQRIMRENENRVKEMGNDT